MAFAFNFTPELRGDYKSAVAGDKSAAAGDADVEDLLEAVQA